MRRIAFVVAWVAATFVTGLVAWGAVRVAGLQVTDEAVRPLSAAEVAALPTAPSPTSDVDAGLGTLPPTTAAGAAATSGDDAIGPDLVPSPATSSLGATATTGTPAPTAVAPSTTAATTPTTTTPAPTTSAPATISDVKTYNTGGGSVTIVVSPGVVELGSASPAAGFQVEVEKDGPEEVRVKFESSGDDEEEEEEYEFSAKWEGGRLRVDID